MEIKTAMHVHGAFVDELLDVWEASVRATHHFLTEDDVKAIKIQAREAFMSVKAIMYTVDEKGGINGFMAVEDGKIEMLFLHPDYRGQGIGKKFIHHAVHVLQASLVDVNEQNTQAVGFYTHMGFKVRSRSPLDANGNPFPILHMSR